MNAKYNFRLFITRHYQKESPSHLSALIYCVHGGFKIQAQRLRTSLVKLDCIGD